MQLPPDLVEEIRANAKHENHENIDARMFITELSKKPDGKVWVTYRTISGKQLMCVHYRPEDCRALIEGLVKVLEGPVDNG